MRSLDFIWKYLTTDQVQIRASRAGLENIIIPDEAAIRRAYETARRGGGGVNRLQKPASMISPTTSMTKSVSESGNMAVTSQPPADNTTNNGAGWRIGELEWEAWMRALDGAGFRTGHLYRQPHLRASSSASCPRTQLPPVPRTPHTHSRLLSSGGYYSALNLSEIATPPSCSATGTLDESNHEAVARDRLALLRREQERVRWLHSPNCYQRVRILESGTDKPRVFTKWVQESGVGARSSSQCTPVKTTSQFSPPLGTTGSGDPRELKHRQRLLKENRLAGMLGAGPSSNVLETNLRSYEEGLDEWQYNSRVRTNRIYLPSTSISAHLYRHRIEGDNLTALPTQRPGLQPTLCTQPVPGRDGRGDTSLSEGY